MLRTLTLFLFGPVQKLVTSNCLSTSLSAATNIPTELANHQPQADGLLIVSFWPDAIVGTLTIVGIVVGVLAAFGAAYFAAWLQRKWTPDPTSAIEDVAKRVNELQRPLQTVENRIKELHQRIEAIERERAERKSFTLGMRLQQAQSTGQWILQVKNDNDYEIVVQSVRLFRDNAPLSNADRPNGTDDWRIPAHQQKPICWTPHTNPIMKLRFAGKVAHGFTEPYEFVLECLADEKPRTARAKLHLNFDGSQLREF